jgi:hypothetical protein
MLKGELILKGPSPLSWQAGRQINSRVNSHATIFKTCLYFQCLSTSIYNLPACKKQGVGLKNWFIKDPLHLHLLDRYDTRRQP